MSTESLPNAQHPDAAGPCGTPTRAVEPGYDDFLCQRGAGHPGQHEVMLRDGSQLVWGWSEVDGER